MQLSGEVHRFAGACESLLAAVTIHRPLRADEVRLIRHYCDEILKTIPPASLEDQEPAPPTSSPVTSWVFLLSKAVRVQSVNHARTPPM